MVSRAPVYHILWVRGFRALPFPGADSILSSRCGAISGRLHFAVTPSRATIPPKRPGSKDRRFVLAAFDRVVTSGRPELVLVSGYSGIGKSAVVNELHKALAPTRGLFASGKFDQYKGLLQVQPRPCPGGRLFTDTPMVARGNRQSAQPRRRPDQVT
jgi:hypothetical protein